MTLKRIREARQLVTCPVRGCGGRRYPDQLLCRYHWFGLPSALRDEIVQLNLRAKGSQEHRSACYRALRLAGESAAARRKRTSDA